MAYIPIIHNLKPSDEPLYQLANEYNKRISELEHAKKNSGHLSLNDKVALYRHIQSRINDAYARLKLAGADFVEIR